MKKIFVVLLLGLFLGGCGDDSAKCDNKIALETLGNLLKNGIWKQYSLANNKQEARQALNDFRLYLDKDVKIKFSSFRTQSKDEFSCRCIAKVELIFPEPPDSVKFVQETCTRELRKFWEDDKITCSLRLDLLSPGLTTVFNETQEMDNVIYDIRVTDDKKEVYTRFVNIDTRLFPKSFQ